MSETSTEREKRHGLERQALRALILEHARDPSGTMLAIIDLLGVQQDSIHAGEKDRAELRNLLLPDEATQQEREFIGAQQRQARWFEGIDWFKTTIAGLIIGALFVALLNLVQCKKPGPEKSPTPAEVRGANSRSKSTTD